MRKILALLFLTVFLFMCSGSAGAELVILKEQDEMMRNTYTLLAVDPLAPFTDAGGKAVDDVAINTQGADALMQFLLSEEGLALADSHGAAEYGEALFHSLEDAPVYRGEIAPARDETRHIRLSTTTSVYDSGLLGKLLPAFEEKFGYDVDVCPVGTGKAIASARFGNADLILVHSRSQEEPFVEAGFARIADGFSTERVSFVYNYFVICGPADDPAGVASAETVAEAFKSIADGRHSFISRGDLSGTHTKELTLWPLELGITAQAESFRPHRQWYVSANAGMGVCLVMADQMEAYILSDKGTFLSFASGSGF